MDIEVAQRQFVCVEYPAVVKNVDKMLATLGGEKGISEVHNDPTKRLELKFRPDDPYCKIVHGEYGDTTNLLLKVVVRRRKIKPETPVSAETDPGKIVKVEIVGNIHKTCRFKSLCDYQYLPIERKEEGYRNLLPSLVPKGLVTSSWLDEECPLMIVPPIFTRIVNPSNYHFPKNVTGQNDPEEASIIGRARSRRSGYGIFINAEDPAPLKPAGTQGQILKSISPREELLTKIEECFSQRPIWSSNALAIVCKSQKQQIMKQVLPAFGYYFLTGPWRGLWVKFGYDPRTNPESKIYQLLDIRIRVPPGIKLSFLDLKRQNQMKLTNKMLHTKPVVRIIETQKLQSNQQEEQQSDEEYSKPDIELRYKFKEGCLPKFKQMFYQLCDVEIDAVKQLIASDVSEIYRERDGWFSPGVLEKCRQLILADINKSFDKIKKAEIGEKGMKQKSTDDNEDEEDYDEDEEDELSYDSDLDEEMDISFD